MTLVQQELSREGGLYPWRMLVACVLLNRSRGDEVRPVLGTILDRFPTPQRLAKADLRLLKTAIRPTGLQDRKARTLREISRRYEEGCDPSKLPGVGPYALESWRLFVEGKLDWAPPADAQLREVWRDRWLDRYRNANRQLGALQMLRELLDRATGLHVAKDVGVPLRAFAVEHAAEPHTPLEGDPDLDFVLHVALDEVQRLITIADREMMTAFARCK